MTVIIGIDPHKRSHTAVALDIDDEVLGEVRVAADARQISKLLRFAKEWPDRIWAVENANGLGRLLARQLVETGETVIDVPARLSAQVRTLSGAGHKTDAHDAYSTAIACRRAKRLRPVVADGETVLLGLLIERRHHIASHRQINTVLHVAAKTQRRLPGPGRDYIERRIAEGKTVAEATRSLKRHLSNVVYRTLLADQEARVSGEDKRAA